MMSTSITGDGSRGHHRFTLNVSESYVSDGASNYSTLNWNLVLSPIQNGWDWYNPGVVGWSVWVAGTNYQGDIDSYDGYSTVTIASGSLNVTHEDNGTKLINISFAIWDRISASYLPGDAGAVQYDVALTTIPRYATITSFSVAKRDETSVTYSWSANATCDSAWYSKDNGSTWQGLPTNNVVSGLSANTTYNFKLRVRRADSQLTTDSGTIQQTTYNYPYCTETPNFTIENNVTIKLYNPLNRTVKIQMWSHVSGQFVSDLIQVSGTSYKGFSNVANRLYASIPNTTTSKYNIDVWYGNNKATKVGGNYSINANVCKPTFSNFEYSTDLSELTGDNETIINGKTNTTVLISSTNKAIGKNSATILRYSIQCGTQTPKLVNYSNNDVSTILNNCNSDIIKVTAIDSRGLETAVNKTIPNFKNYFVPTFVLFNVDRENGIDERAYLDLRLQFWNYNFGLEDNIIKSIKYRVKEQGTNTWSLWFDTNPSSWVIDNEQLTITDLLVYIDGISQGFTIGKTYNLQLQVIDGTLDEELTTIVSSIFNLSDGKVAFSILKDSNGEYHLGINGMPDLNLNLKVHGTSG